jgi:hypothetical protein
MIAIVAFAKTRLANRKDQISSGHDPLVVPWTQFSMSLFFQIQSSGKIGGVVNMSAMSTGIGSLEP